MVQRHDDPIEPSGPQVHQQDQFLSVVSREEAIARWDAALPPTPMGEETVALSAASGRVLSRDVAAAIDVPPFDRALVDGFALRAGDAAGATASAPVRLALNDETIHCGTPPALEVAPGAATPIATGGPIPRGADAVAMIEHTDPDPSAGILLRRPVGPGQGVGFAGGDIALGETLLRSGALIGSREIGMLAAAGVGNRSGPAARRVAVLSTGDELIQPGEPLRPAAIYDSNGPMVAAAVAENGGEAVLLGAVADNEAAQEAALAKAHAECDMVNLSGGTSKGAGDITYRLVGHLGEPGIVVHGVALKPGKPLCLAVADGKPVVVLPGFWTSAMFTFHDFVAPVIRRRLDFVRRARAASTPRSPWRRPPISDAPNSSTASAWFPAPRAPSLTRSAKGRVRRHLLRPGRRLCPGRCAGGPPSGRGAGARHVARRRGESPGSYRHRQPLPGARGGDRGAGPSRALGALGAGGPAWEDWRR